MQIDPTQPLLKQAWFESDKDFEQELNYLSVDRLRLLDNSINKLLTQNPKQNDGDDSR